MMPALTTEQVMHDSWDQKNIDYYYPKAGNGFFILFTGLTLGSACTFIWLAIANFVFG